MRLSIAFVKTKPGTSKTTSSVLLAAGDVESTKAVVDFCAPVPGEVDSVNAMLTAEPETV